MVCCRQILARATIEKEAHVPYLDIVQRSWTPLCLESDFQVSRLDVDGKCGTVLCGVVMQK